MAYNMPSRASQLLRQLSAADFYAQDLKLFLDTHPDDEVGVFFQKKSKVFHGVSFLPCKPRRCIFYLTV